MFSHFYRLKVVIYVYAALPFSAANAGWRWKERNSG